MDLWESAEGWDHGGWPGNGAVQESGSRGASLKFKNMGWPGTRVAGHLELCDPHGAGAL